MPLDVLGRTRATLTHATSRSAGPKGSLANLLNLRRARDRLLQLLVVQRGMPCRRESPTRIEYVPALCTHRPSLLPMNVKMKFSEGSDDPGLAWRSGIAKLLESEHFEEGEVVTRFP